MAWDLSCVDWQDRIRTGRSLVPDLPLDMKRANRAIAIFDKLKLADVPGNPVMKDACGEWFRDLVRALMGGFDAATGERMIRELFGMVPKKNAKTSYSALLMLTALLVNARPNADFLLVAPTQDVADLAYKQIEGAVELDPKLSQIIHLQPHLKMATYRGTNERAGTNAHLKVKSFDPKVMTGVKPAGVLVDEMHILSESAHGDRVMRQIRNGLISQPEGFLITITTQSERPPAGIFKSELDNARGIRDGRIKGKTLPILYEFPDDIARDRDKWSDPANWPMVVPNLGRPVTIPALLALFEDAQQKGEAEVIGWASQMLNIQIGLGLKSDRWAGADYWERRNDLNITYDTLLERSEVLIIGVDGGGLDDLYGFTALGREKEETELTVRTPSGEHKTISVKRWLSWSHAWCHEGVLERRKSIASRLRDFEAMGELTIVSDELQDIADIVDYVERAKDSGLLAEVAVDPAGLGEFVDAMAKIDITLENKMLVGVGQGYRMMNAIKTGERRLASGTWVHAKSTLMDWAVANLKIEPMATAIRATKQTAGDAKIDPAMAAFNAIDRMSLNPAPAGISVFDRLAQIDAKKAREGDDSPEDDEFDQAILDNPQHPLWTEMKERYERKYTTPEDSDYDL